MIQDLRYLEAEFVPNEVIHRDNEVNHLSGVLQPLTEGEPAETTMITGPTGSGKTCISRYVVKKLHKENPDITSVYVNCWQHYNRYKALFKVLDGLERTYDIHRQSTPRDVILERLREHDESNAVVIFDEVDQLEDENILYELNRLPQYTLVLIVNRVDELLAVVDDRLSSRLRGSERIHFNQYTDDELIDILSNRAKHAFDPGVVGKRELSIIAEKAGGDARYAITTLRLAARRAERMGESRITRETARDAVPEARRELRQKDIESLTPHQQIVYEIIEEGDEVSPGDLYREYRRRVKNPKSERTLRNYVAKMEQYNLVETHGSTRDRIIKSVKPNLKA